MKTNHILWLSALLWVVAACGGDDCEPGPCAGVPAPSAAFTIGEGVGKATTVFYAETDTITERTLVRFAATQTFDRYEWWIGREGNTRSGDTVFVNFYADPGEPPIVGDIFVTFRGQRAPDTTCFPGDDGIVEMSKRLTIVPEAASPLIDSRWRGYDEHAPDVFYEISIDSSFTNAGSFGGYQITNLSNDPCAQEAAMLNPMSNMEPISLGYRSFGGGERAAIGCGENGAVTTSTPSDIFGQLSADHQSMIITYVKREPFTDIEYQRRFVGQRIN